MLYVEDEEYDRLFMEAAFRRADMAAAYRAVVDGHEAKRYLEGVGDYADRTQHPLPKVVLLDLNLPLVSGFELLRWMRTLPELVNLPVLIFSSSSLKEDRDKAAESGANEFLEKPSSMVQFSIAVERAMKWASGGA